MIRDLAYEALSRAFWATMGTLARLAFWALGDEPVSAPAHDFPVWNWCAECAQPVDVPGDAHDGTEARCCGCRKWFVVVDCGDRFVLDPREEAPRASRATPMPIAPEARVPLNAGKYEPAEDHPAAAQGADVAHMLPKEATYDLVAVSSERVACGEFAGSVRAWVRGRDQWLFACKASGYEPCSACLAAADAADPRGLDHDLCVAIGLCRDSEREDNRDAAHHFLMVASAHSLSIAGPALRARVERYRAAVGAS